VFFFIVLCFFCSVPFSLDSPGIGYQITAGEKRNPNWHRYNAHFTYLGPTSAMCLLRYVSVHHHSNHDPTSDLTSHPKTQTYHSSIKPITEATITPAFLGSLHGPYAWVVLINWTKRYNPRTV